MSDLSSMTLTEFLLARAANTIALAREIQALAVARGLQPDDPREPSLRLAGLVLAECEAKRRIVAEWQDMEDVAELEHESGRIMEALSFEAKSAALEVALRFLALPHADHPDYREEWKP